MPKSGTEMLLLLHGFPLTLFFPGPKNSVKGGVPVQPKLKGNLTSKCLFGIFNSPKKIMKKWDFTPMVPQVELFPFVF